METNCIQSLVTCKTLRCAPWVRRYPFSISPFWPILCIKGLNFEWSVYCKIWQRYRVFKDGWGWFLQLFSHLPVHFNGDFERVFFAQISYKQYGEPKPRDPETTIQTLTSWRKVRIHRHHIQSLCKYLYYLIRSLKSRVIDWNLLQQARFSVTLKWSNWYKGGEFALKCYLFW